MLVKFTCGEQVAEVTPTCWSHTPVVGKCPGDTPTRCSHTPAVGKCPRDAPTRWSHTPVVGKCLRDEPTYSPGALQSPLEAFGPLLVELVPCILIKGTR